MAVIEVRHTCEPIVVPHPQRSEYWAAGCLCGWVAGDDHPFFFASEGQARAGWRHHMWGERERRAVNRLLGTETKKGFGVRLKSYLGLVKDARL